MKKSNTKAGMIKIFVLATSINFLSAPAAFADDTPFLSRLIQAYTNFFVERIERQEREREQYCWQGQCAITLGIRG